MHKTANLRRYPRKLWGRCCKITSNQYIIVQCIVGYNFFHQRCLVGSKIDHAGIINQQGMVNVIRCLNVYSQTDGGSLSRCVGEDKDMLDMLDVYRFLGFRGCGGLKKWLERNGLTQQCLNVFWPLRLYLLLTLSPLKTTTQKWWNNNLW